MLIILRDQRVKAQSGHFHMGESNLLSIRTLSTKLHQINVYTIHHPVEKLLEKIHPMYIIKIFLPKFHFDSK